MNTEVEHPQASPISVRPIAVEADGLGKIYRTGFWFEQKVEPLKNCSLVAYQGETFGLLGPNGAGKTTLLKCLLGIVRPTRGRGSLLGKPLGDRAAKHYIGYLPENPYFYDYLTGWEFLQFVAGLFEIPAPESRSRIPELLDLVGLDRARARKQQMRRYSKGMLQRVGIAQALINDPEVVFLDEPMSGLDPLGRARVREIIEQLKARGKTVFFNSHILTDVEKICDRVALLNGGELVCMGALPELLGEAKGYRVKGQGGDTDVLRKWLTNLTFAEGNWQGDLTGGVKDFLGSLQLMEAELIALDRARPTLEEFFLAQLHQRHTAI